MALWMEDESEDFFASQLLAQVHDSNLFDYHSVNFEAMARFAIKQGLTYMRPVLDYGEPFQLDVTLKEMERKLLRIILNPAMILAFLFGLSLIWIDGHVRGWGFLLKPWMLTKLAGVLFLVSWHGFLSGARRRFEKGENRRSEKFWRVTNELPFLAAVVMVISITTKFLD